MAPLTEVHLPPADAVFPPPESPGNPAKDRAHLRKILRIGARVLLVLLVFVLSLGSLAYGAGRILCLGPSPSARDLFVISCEETSALKFFPRLFLPEEEIQAIFAQNSVVELAEVTDAAVGFIPPPEDTAIEEISLHEVFGDTFKGKMLIIQDPSRVRLAALDAFGRNVSGLKIESFVAQTGAVAGINAGGFEDKNGLGSGGEPIGLIVQCGELRNGNLAHTYDVIGFDAEHKLIVGRMTGQQAMDRGIRDGVSFGPVFIVNGTPAEVVGSGGGLNPRTVIGQRADGAVLMLVIDGRQPSSLGASYRDCIDVMLEYGAINAANLDGGSSSVMVYEGEIVNVCASLYGSRQQPSAFIVD